MKQSQVIAALANIAHRDNALVVSEIGSQSLWLYASGDHPSHLYLSGPMGMASSIALGVALAMPNCPVIAICGDGALAMNLGSLATISQARPPNLALIVMDNGVYDFTGDLTSPSSTIDWEKLIAGLKGFTACSRFSIGDELRLQAVGGPRFLYSTVNTSDESYPKLPLSGWDIHKRFLAYLQN